MILVHMRDRALLREEERFGPVEVGRHLGRRQPGRFGEAAVQVTGLHHETSEGEVREIDVELGLGVAREKAPPHRLALGELQPSRDGEPRMGERIALARDREQDRGARIGIHVLRMGREPRDQDQRRPAGIGRHRDERRERHAGPVVERRERAGPDAPQQALREHRAVEFTRVQSRLRHAVPCLMPIGLAKTRVLP